MKPPKAYSKIKIEPLLIYWMPISNTGSNNSFFSVSISELNPNINTSFQNLHIFSVSLYLRKLLKEGESYIDLDMPHIEERMKILDRILSK
jgi:hypothetical protein